MLHFFRKNITCGVSQCSKREAKANHSYLPDYDAAKPTSYLLYLDATNLYGKAMSMYLPQEDSRWLSQNEI